MLVVCFTVFGGLMAFNYNRVLQVWTIPLLLVTFFAYLVAHSFLSVFETVLDALFLCFAVDLETNDGSSEKPYFMDQDFLVSKHFILCCNLPSSQSQKAHMQRRLPEPQFSPRGLSGLLPPWPVRPEWWDSGSVFQGWTTSLTETFSLEKSEAGNN